MTAYKTLRTTLIIYACIVASAVIWDHATAVYTDWTVYPCRNQFALCMTAPGFDIVSHVIYVSGYGDSPLFSAAFSDFIVFLTSGLITALPLIIPLALLRKRYGGDE